MSAAVRYRGHRYEPVRTRTDSAYTVGSLPQVHKALKKVPAHIRSRVRRFIVGLKQEPRPHNVEKLINYDVLWRARFGSDYRLVYAIYDEQQHVTVTLLTKRGAIDYWNLREPTYTEAVRLER
jgi:mRNA-degrading endonuclease RelE of RelBE toxin-antitoxin system